MAPDSIVNYGGDLYVLISTGLVPMSTLLKAETDNLGKSDQNIMQEFSDVSKTYRDAYGWSVILNSQTNHAICNMPIGSGKYQQLVRFMPNPIWSKWVDVPARCWAWLDNHAYFGSENGGIYRTGREYLNDDGTAINVDVRFAWSSFKSVDKKQFKLIRLYMIIGQHAAAVRRRRSRLRRPCRRPTSRMPPRSTRRQTGTPPPGTSTAGRSTRCRDRTGRASQGSAGSAPRASAPASRAARSRSRAPTDLRGREG